MPASPPQRVPIDRTQILKSAAALGVLGAGNRSGPRLMAALCNPEVDGRDVAGLIRSEPALYARVLRVANSPYYGQSRAITSIERALPLLGLDAVRGIAAAACLDHVVVQGGAPLEMQALVRHSMATAAASDALARIHHRALAGEAFIAGLLHNLGVAVQIHLDTPGVQAMIEVRRVNPCGSIRELESDRVLVGHEECVAVIFEAWKLPAGLVAAVRHHHDPLGAPEPYRALACLVNLGATLALACGHTFTLEPAPAERHAGAMALLELTAGDLDRVEAALPERLAALRSALLEG